MLGEIKKNKATAQLIIENSGEARPKPVQLFWGFGSL
jgi:hypothetical protein